MNPPVVSPSKVRSDLVFLSPDLHRPGFVLRMRSAEDATQDFGLAEVIRRTETGLASTAQRYRALFGSGLALLLSPGLLAWAAWVLLFRLHSPGFQPFWRGYHVPVFSLYELVTYLVVFALVAVVLWLSFDALMVMRGMGPDYRFFRDATPDMRQAVAEEISTGSWPRTHALLKRGREFKDYRALLESRSAARSDATSV